MRDYSITAMPPGPIPADDPARTLTMVHPDDAALRRVSVVGDIYTILVPGSRTEGRYCLIDMIVPDGSGPPPHRHDFEEMFTLLEGELLFTFRGEQRIVSAGSTVNVPANAPHAFKNVSGTTVHMLCMCTPAGLDAFFLEVGVPAARGGAVPAARPEEDGKARPMATLLSVYRTEIVGA